MPSSDTQFKKGHKFIKGGEKGWFKKGYKPSEETKRKIGLTSKGRIGYWKDKKRPPISEEQKEKLRKINIEIWDKIGRKNRRPAHDRWEYRNWKLKVFVRDNFTCQVCKKIGGNLEAHHIKGFAHYPKLRYKIDNGITLCKKCHRLTDSYGHKIIGRELEESEIKN